MIFKCGIIGLPNVGKSTIFNMLTKANIKTANFPFCTIKPNIGIVQVPDIRLKKIAKIVKPKRILSANIEFIDTAGLIKDSSKGKGLGNHFLDCIRQTDVICHVVRCFENENVAHIAGRIDPIRDISIINTELILSDLDVCERAIFRITERVKNGNKESKIELEILRRCLLQLENNSTLRNLSLDKEEKNLINHLNFLTIKPTIYIVNNNENNLEDNLYLNEIRNFAKEKDNSVTIPIYVKIKENIAKVHNKNYDESIQNSKLDFLVNTNYDLLNLQTYFTANIKEVRAWPVQRGTTAIQAAGRIHTDFKRGFIRAQIVSFRDFINYKGKYGAKNAGKIHIEGKDYLIKDGDIINFLFQI